MCGSTSQPDRLAAAQAALRLEGWATFGVAPLGRSPAADEAAMLDAVHRRQIDLSDVVVIVAKPDETLGQATTAERDYAQQTGKRLVYYHDRPEQQKGTVSRA